MLEGFADSTFKPGIDVQRDQSASLMARWPGVDPQADGPFTDVVAGSTYAGAINALAAVVKTPKVSAGDNFLAGPRLNASRDTPFVSANLDVAGEPVRAVVQAEVDALTADGRNGHLWAPQDPSPLRHAVTAPAGDPAARDRYARAAHHDVHDPTCESIGDELLSHCLAVLHHPVTRWDVG